jgi:hypothetical protein
MNNPSKDAIPSVLLPLRVYSKMEQAEFVMGKDGAPQFPRPILLQEPALNPKQADLNLHIRTPAHHRKVLRVSHVGKREHFIANKYAPPGRSVKNNDAGKTVLRSIVENSVRTCRLSLARAQNRLFFEKKRGGPRCPIDYYVFYA